MTNSNDLTGKVVLVSGASRGIGYATAKEIARRGAHVIAVARTIGGLEELDDEIQREGGATTLVPLDLTDGAGIDRLGKAIFDRWGQLDGLIVNAAMLGPISPLSHISPKDFAKVLDINVTAPFRLVRSLDVLLKASDGGRVVFVSSNSATSAKPYWGLYAASKAALNALAKSYAGELANTNVKVNVFYPGAVRTGMRAKAVPGEDPATLQTPADIAPKLADLISPTLSQNGQIFDVQTGEFCEI